MTKIKANTGSQDWYFTKCCKHNFEKQRWYSGIILELDTFPVPNGPLTFMEGNEKLSLFIGKIQSSRCFKGIKCIELKCNDSKITPSNKDGLFGLEI